MWMVVGLGNPGPTYAKTRHNVGFMVIDRLAERWHVSFEASPSVRAGSAHVGGQRVTLVQPQTFMNRSGAALASLDPAPTDTLVAVYDDLDLPVGRLRVRAGGGSGGHRGVLSLTEHFGPDFFRIRIGIGRPVDQAVADYVLAPPSAAEHAALAPTLERAADAVECLLAEGPTAAMNRFNGQAAVEP